MEVKPGYKQTEVGIIPEDWELKPLAAIADKIMVGIASAATHAYRTIGVPMFRNQNIKAGMLDDSDLLFVEPEYEVVFKNKRLRGGDLLTMRTGYPGVTAIVPPRYDSAQSFTTLITRPRQQDAESAYLCHFINSECGQRFFTQSQIGGAQKNVNVGTLRTMPIPLPKPPEQRAIAEALSDVDGLLGGLDRLIAKKRDLKQAAMQQLLTGQTRLPGFKGEWVERTLSQLAAICSGGTPSTSDPRYWDGDIPWCTPTDITALDGQKYLATTSHMITADGLAASSAELIPARSVIMTSRATIGECAINSVPVCTNQGFKNFVPYESTDVEFLYYLLQTQKQKFISLCGGSTFLEIGKTQLAPFVISLPDSKAEQTAIAEVLADMDTELAALEQRREKTRALKQAMMQELLTGRIRLVDVTVQSTAKKEDKAHNWAINEAVVVAVLVKRFGTEKYPLGRKRCTKLSYLLHRHVEHAAEGYLKKAAGPYNPAVKYGGPEGIAQKNGYIRPHASGKFTGFIAGDKIAQAEGYFGKWYGGAALEWLEQFRFKSNDDLELLTTVDMAMEDLRRAGAGPTLDGVKGVIRRHPEWEAKLDRAVFSDQNIAAALPTCRDLFPA